MPGALELQLELLHGLHFQQGGEIRAPAHALVVVNQAGDCHCREISTYFNHHVADTRRRHGGAGGACHSRRQGIHASSPWVITAFPNNSSRSLSTSESWPPCSRDMILDKLSRVRSNHSANSESWMLVQFECTTLLFSFTGSSTCHRRFCSL